MSANAKFAKGGFAALAVTMLLVIIVVSATTIGPHLAACRDVQSQHALRMLGFDLSRNDHSAIKYAPEWIAAHLPEIYELRVKRSLPLHEISLGSVRAPLESLAPSITSFQCSSVTADDDDIDVIAKMTQVRDLQVNGAALTNSGASQLHTLERLRRLEVYAPLVHHDGLLWLKNCAELDSLWLGGVPLTEPMLSSITPNLRHLSFDGRFVGHCELRAISKMPKLERLEIVGMNVDSEGLSQLSKLRELDHLNLRGAMFHPGAASRIADIPTLRIVVLSESNVRMDDVVRIVCDLPRLERLWVYNCGITHSDVAKLLSREELSRVFVGSAEQQK